ILQPLAMMAMFTFIFSTLVRMPSDGVPYPLFAYSGLLPWTFFAASVSSGTISLTSHAGLMTKVAFPREIIPATYVVAAAVDLTIALATLMALTAWYRFPLTWHVFAGVPIVLALAALALA